MLFSLVTHYLLSSYYNNSVLSTHCFAYILLAVTLSWTLTKSKDYVLDLLFNIGIYNRTLLKSLLNAQSRS